MTAPKKRSIARSTSMTNEQSDALDRLALRDRTNPSVVVRKALAHYLRTAPDDRVHSVRDAAIFDEDDEEEENT